jgi:hypothetical protein
MMYFIVGASVHELACAWYGTGHARTMQAHVSDVSLHAPQILLVLPVLQVALCQVPSD